MCFPPYGSSRYVLGREPSDGFRHRIEVFRFETLRAGCKVQFSQRLEFDVLQ